MTGHYQLLVQQTVLCVRAAQKARQKVNVGESQEDLAEILDGAVGMLQDLDQNRKDAIRNSIQLHQSVAEHDDTGGRLTRAAFLRTLQHTSATSAPTLFDVGGLASLRQTFHTLDTSKDRLIDMKEADACQFLLKQSGANIDPTYVPSTQDVTTLLSDPSEVFGKDSPIPTSEPQVVMLKKDRNQFTSAEDSLVFRGVNLYGEKQWLLIADRYLPDRSINIISQRYSKLSLMVYRAHNIRIDGKGYLQVPPKHESVDRVNDGAISKIKKCSPPAILNVHRWSIEEDLTLLKAVPILGHMWAELSTRFIPHRDRGHLRKRYQVLERRIRATVTRAAKEAPKYTKSLLAKKAQLTSKVRQLPTTIKGPTAAHLLRPPPKFMRKPGVPLPATGNKGPKPTRVESRPHSSTVDSGSRSNFEKILAEGDEWSQMSRVKKLMDGDTVESEIASSIVSNMKKGEVNNIQHLPPLNVDQSSGLSLLGDTALSQEAGSPSKARKPLLSQVLKKTPDKIKSKSSLAKTTPKTAAAANSLTSLSRCNSLQAPETNGNSRAPSTPLRNPTTSIFNSPRFSSPSKMPHSGSLKQHGFASPGNSLLNDGYDFCTFSISERSRQAMETPTKAGSGPTPSPRVPAPSYSEENSLMQGEFKEEDDYAMISALHALSNSPAKALMQRPYMFDDEDEEAPPVSSLFGSDPPTPPPPKAPSAKRSLFQTVVSGASSRKKAKR